MKKILSLFAITAIALAFTSCGSSNDDDKEQAYQYFVEWDSETANISYDNVELLQLFNDIKADVERWNKINASAYSVRYKTPEELAGYDIVAITNFTIFQKAFTNWKAKEYDDKLKNVTYYGAGSFKITYKVHVQSIVGSTKDLSEPVAVTFEYANELPL